MPRGKFEWNASHHDATERDSRLMARKRQYTYVFSWDELGSKLLLPNSVIFLIKTHFAWLSFNRSSQNVAWIFHTKDISHTYRLSPAYCHCVCLLGKGKTLICGINLLPRRCPTFHDGMENVLLRPKHSCMLFIYLFFEQSVRGHKQLAKGLSTKDERWTMDGELRTAKVSETTVARCCGRAINSNAAGLESFNEH